MMKWTMLIPMLLVPFAVAAEEASPATIYVVHFTKGAGWDEAIPVSQQAGFREHSANLQRLRKDGSITFGARYDDVGMLFLKAPSLDAAIEIIAADPGVQAGTFAYSVAELHVFYAWQP